MIYTENTILLTNNDIQVFDDLYNLIDELGLDMNEIMELLDVADEKRKKWGIFDVIYED